MQLEEIIQLYLLILTMMVIPMYSSQSVQDLLVSYTEMTEMAKQWVPFHNKKFKHFDFDKSQIQTEKSMSVSRVQDHIDSLA